MPAKGLGGVEWVVSRGLCRFGRFDLKSVPAPQRRQALQLQILQWSPFAETAQCVVWDGDAALVWVWDESRIQPALESAKLNRRRVAFLPETLLHHVERDSCRLVQCLDGFEGQVWRGGSLAASRWWPGAPDLGGWNAFVRDSGGAAGESVPAPRQLDLLGRPWAAPAGQAGAAIAWRHEALAVMTGCFVLATTTFWSLAQWFQYADAVETEKNRLVELEQRARPIQEARRQALDLQGRIGFLRGLHPYPPHSVLLAEVGKRLPMDGTYIKEWDFQGGRLRVALSAPGKPQASAFVKTFQDSGWFKDVQVPSGSDPTSLAMEMTVLRLAELSLETIEGKARPADRAANAKDGANPPPSKPKTP